MLVVLIGQRSQNVDYLQATNWRMAVQVCEACHDDADDENLLLCDTCDSGYHTYCLKPKLTRIPSGEWHCPKCQVRARHWLISVVKTVC
jgi:hypothetical protein